MVVHVWLSNIHVISLCDSYYSGNKAYNNKIPNKIYELLKEKGAGIFWKPKITSLFLNEN